MIGTLLTLLLTAWCLAVLALVWIFRRPVLAAWREPVLAVPVLVIESDDWGPGPAYQCAALKELEQCLAAVTDARGHQALITLGLTLSVPDGDYLREHECREYRARWLDHPDFSAQLAALRGGIERGLFAPQLHGSAHYWPPALLEAAQRDSSVRDWLLGGEHETERLPGHLQSRWTDAGVLPSRPLDPMAQRAAVTEEAAAYRRLFGQDPRVVVPPTFLWNREVEKAWAGEGTVCLITPGRRFTLRDARGMPDGVDRVMRNHEAGEGGLRYLVRDLYFEPSLGHGAESTLAGMADRVALGLPCLVEMHRFNFTDSRRQASIAELARLLRLSLERFPGLRFMSSETLDHEYRHGGDCLERSTMRRVAVRLERLLRLPRFGKLARLSGLAIPMRLVAGAWA